MKTCCMSAASMGADGWPMDDCTNDEPDDDTDTMQAEEEEEQPEKLGSGIKERQTLISNEFDDPSGRSWLARQLLMGFASEERS